MNRRGFSLVELIVVTAIISILLGIATLNFNQWQRKSQVERTVKELYADLMQARQQAMVTGLRHRARFVTANQVSFHRYSSEFDILGTQLSQKSLSYAIERSAPWVGNEIEFNSRGMMEDAQPKAVCVFSDAGPAIDGIAILQSRISLGKITNQGNSCATTNITLK